MKPRPRGFLEPAYIDHSSEVFEYVSELHEYLWRFVRVHTPEASGNLADLLDAAIEVAERERRNTDIFKAAVLDKGEWRMTAKDGTVFGVFNQGNGDYIASQDDRGFHHAPPSYSSLPSWSDREANRRLKEAVDEYNDEADE